MKHLDVGFKIKAADDSTGEFSGYGAVFGNVDRHRDVILPGAFKSSLEYWLERKTLPAMLWQHQMSEPIGIWSKIAEDDRGLYVEGRVLTSAGELERRAYAHLKAGSVSGLSIGYKIPPLGGEYDAKADVFKLKVLDLFEVSVVTTPANDEALIDAVKAALGSPREFERLLRDAGLSRTQAKALMSGGYKALTQRDADDDDASDVAKAIAALTEKFDAAVGR
jgi:HK97 family phage prohead protease